MPSILDRYWYELRGKFDRLPVWLPGTSMNLGDVGVLDVRGWSRVRSLKEMGVKFEMDSEGAPTSYSYSSGRGAEVSVTAGARVSESVAMLTGGAAEIRMRFSRAGAFVLIADDVEVQSICDLDEVDTQMLRLYERGEWEAKWCLISEVAIAARSLVVVAGDGQGEATVAVGAEVAGGGMSPGDADGGLRFTYRKDLEASFATSSPSTVMWRGRYVRDPILRRLRVQERGVSSSSIGRPDDADEIMVCEAEYPSDIVALTGHSIPGGSEAIGTEEQS